MLADAKSGAPFPPNTMLDEKYRLDQLLEVGGMGAVYIGTHTKLQKQVAIKVLRRELAQIPDMIERFQREAIAASRIGHENIVNVSDLGTGRDGSPFLVMEFLNGHTLGARIRQHGAMSIPTACAVAREILSAVSAAHQAGIIHRDLKPENVFIVRGSRGESIKILDFGISRVMEAQGEAAGEHRLTYTGQVMGTPYYMAPEQAAGRSDLGPPVDVYATGVILYEMLSGVVPFEAGNYNTIIYKVLAGQYEPLSKRLTGVPPDLEAIVARAMALQPEARFATADELAAALEPYAYGAAFVPGSSPHMPVLPPGSSPHMPVVPGSSPRMPAVPSYAPTTPRSEPPRARPRRVWPLVLIAVLALGGAAAAGIVLASQGGGEEEEEPAPAKSEPAPAAAAPTAPAQPAEPARVVIRVEVDPPDAVVTAGGEPLTGGELVRPKSDATIEITASREGHISKTRTVGLGESRTVEMILEKEPAAAPAPPKKRPAGGKKRKPGDHDTGSRPDRIIDDSPYD
ncbi:MAG TPA: serine/threonine-protein kinase [Kofleriaceae bacterium]|nr:serine/threonine-protein kinase [Kofleriaceae bacterium]